MTPNNLLPFVLGFVLMMLLMMSLTFIFTYPFISENNADFFCESRDLIVKDFGQDRGSLVFVECEENPVDVVDRFYWENDNK